MIAVSAEKVPDDERSTPKQTSIIHYSVFSIHYSFYNDFAVKNQA